MCIRLKVTAYYREDYQLKLVVRSQNSSQRREDTTDHICSFYVRMSASADKLRQHDGQHTAEYYQIHTWSYGQLTTTRSLLATLLLLCPSLR